MSKHTKGPWGVGMRPRASTGERANVCHVYDRSGTGDEARYDDRPIAHVYGLPSHKTVEDIEDDEECAEGLANARLIAAAPAMLEALKALLIHVEQTADDNGPCDHGNGLCICDLHRDINAARAAIVAAEGTA